MQTWLKTLLLVLACTIVTGDFVFAQTKPAKTDSTLLYKNIENYSARTKSRQFVYHLLFKPLAKTPAKAKPKKKPSHVQRQKPYSAFEGKVIRHIHIATLDPFGYSIGDTIVSMQNFITNAGNKLHIKSQRVTIRNLLLIREKQLFDSLLVKESERLLRSQGFVTDVSFYVKSTAAQSDSVDIYIRELDNWSVALDGAISTSSFNIKLTDNNFMGLGHQSQNEIKWNQTTKQYAYKADYFIPNIRNTYINSTLHIGADELGNFVHSFALDRPFFSPFARWAAGFSLSRVFRRDYIHTNDSLTLLQPFKFDAQDYWAGHSMQLFKGNSENDRSTNFISTIRFLRMRYLDKPAEVNDPQHFFANENFLLGSIGISTRKYLQDKFIFKYGVIEDVPIGKAFSLTAGYQRKHDKGRMYLGANLSSGNYYSWGFLSFNCGYGTFFHDAHAEQGVVAVGMDYFTGLFTVGKWKFRQFIKPQLIIGLRRLAYDSLTLNAGFGIDGFNSSSLSGSSRFQLKFQTQAYSPWSVIGFHFGPYLTYSMGGLGNEASGFRYSRVYSQIGIGVLIKNEHLIINTFQLSLSYYPTIPGRGQNLIKGNVLHTGDFGFLDFVIGKPMPVAYQ